MTIDQKLNALSERIAVLERTVKPSGPKSHIRIITEMAAQEWGVSVRKIRSRTKQDDVVDARHAAIYLVRTVLGWSWQSIARSTGFDYKTVRNGCERIKRLAETEHAFAARMIRFEDRVRLRIGA